MPVFRLDERLCFPPPRLARPDGVLAVGGDLSRERLLLAYRSGIFPWPAGDTLLLWHSPDPRCVLFPERLHVSASLRRVLRSGRYTVTVDRAFAAVIAACATVPRPGQPGTWITPAMQAAYTALHGTGDAHSVETWQDGELVGGLYGVSVGPVFTGESMFARRPDASKVALVHLVEWLQARDYTLVDCQVRTSHLARLGAEEIPRARFLRFLPKPAGPCV